jgi:glutathione S-transferase
MSDVILHHYAASPFAEKIRAILGYKGMAWRSVDIPVVMPKPDLTALTGGYRKTPVLQIGCDVYCDTALISRVLDGLRPEPPVHRPEHGAVEVPAGRWLDHQLFFAVIALLFDPAVMKEGMAALGGPEGVAAFMKDRGPMLATARVKPPSLPDANVIFRDVLGRLDAQLAASGPFLFGDAVGWADFCAYHPLWMASANPAFAPRLAAYPRIGPWLERIRAFGHGEPKPLGSGEALEVARASTPRPREGVAGPALDGIALGDEVEVAADDYALEPSAGRLVHCGADELAIERTDARAGTVVVHFPRIHYTVKRRS